MSLFSDLGFNYVNEMFSSAMMRRGDKVGFLEAVRDDGAVYFRACESGRLGNVEVFNHEEVQSWDSFAYPRLGYRQDVSKNFISYVSRLPSVRRGFHFNEARVEALPACSVIENHIGILSAEFPEIGSRHFSSLPEFKIPLIMAPEYTPFAQGVLSLLAGERPYFCSSPEFAVSTSSEAAGFDILYRQRVIGKVSSSGSVSLTINSPTIDRLWAEEIGNV